MRRMGRIVPFAVCVFFASFAGIAAAATVVVAPMPPSVGVPCAAYPCVSCGMPVALPAAPAWVADPRFLDASHWGDLVDRMGVLVAPGCPVAWKGDAPGTLLAWTGRDWLRIPVRSGESVGDALARSFYDMVVRTRSSGHLWTAADTAFLMAKCAEWNHLWMGLLGVTMP